MKRPFIGLGVVALLLAACHSGSNVPPPATTPSASATTQAPPPQGAMTLPTVHVLLDDPRLQQARLLEHQKDYLGAAKVVHDTHPIDLAPADACAWDYLEGRLYVAGNSAADAIPAFARAENATCPLTGYAKLRSAQQIARSGRADEAIAKAKEVPTDIPPIADDTKMVIAESLAAKGDRAGALPIWRAWLTANPHGSRWVDTSVRIATALLDGIDGEGHQKEAYEVATRVVVEAPKLADSSGATAARLRAVQAIKPKDPAIAEQLSESEKQKQAQAWLDANEATKAFDLTSSMVKAPKASCKVALTHANAGQKKTPKADVWSDTITVCDKDKDPELVTALYAGAKSRTSRDSKTAIEWYGKVESQFPAHRLADDARFRAALLLAQGNDEQRAEEMLRTLPDVYPTGDMRTEALFRAALGSMSKQDWATAKGDLDRILEIQPEDHHWATAGRAEYFRARVAAMTGDAEGARSRYVHVVATHPLSFYFLMAQAQLRAADPNATNKLLDDQIAKDKTGPAGFPSKILPVIDSPAFKRAVKLLEVGDTDAARAEMRSSGATADSADPEAVWSVGIMYNEAGMPDLGHVFSRQRLSDHLEHWPEGKWRTEWETAYPRAYQPLVDAACAKYTLPPAIAFGIMREESSFVADAKSPANAYGLMQLIVPTARGLTNGTPYGADENSLKQPEVSIGLGVRLLSGLRQRHGNDALAIGAYNGGSGSIDKWMKNRTSDDLDLFVENVQFEETRNYIKRVLSSVAAYGYLYDQKSYNDVLNIPIKLK